MKRFLLLALAAGLSLPVQAGIPSSRQGKWMKASENLTTGAIWMIDTEDVELKRSKMRFWVERRQGRNERSDGRIILTWAGKHRIDCKKFTASIHLQTGDALAPYTNQKLGKIRPGTFAYILADNFCYLTGEEGFTPVKNPERWVKKIIQTVQNK